MSTEKVNESDSLTVTEEDGIYIIRNQHGATIAKLGWPACAQNLVTRYNAHPALLAACEAALAYIDNTKTASDLPDEGLITQLRAALQQAGREI